MGTFNFQEIFQRVRAPEQAFSAKSSEHGKYIPLANAHQIVSGEVIGPGTVEGTTRLRVTSIEDPRTMESRVILFPRDQLKSAHFAAVGPKEGVQGQKGQVLTAVNVYAKPRADRYGSMPYWLLVAAGLGIFLGCVGKSAQFPLQVWLPDAMEGPTPVSALIHAATMVAAGVYLVGRAYPLFTPEVLLTIAYVGGITLFVAATIAVVQTDIKKVLAYSTVSQLGYMMLGLGVGGWAAGLFHLITHAFFKALLFLCSGSVIYGCHHVQEMTKMGGLYPKMKTTALTMLMGCLAIAGIPLFSGWYSKDAIVAHALGHSVVHAEHFLLFLLPLLTAGLTTFYMFRMWFMTFTGEPRDHHVHEHAHESPKWIVVPLVVLAFFSIVVAWGWPIWDAEASWLEHQLHHAQPASVVADFGRHHEDPASAAASMEKDKSPRYKAVENHSLAGYLALIMVAIGLSFAFALYYYRVLDPAEAKEQFPGVHRFLTHKWYFDELYSAVLVRPALAVSNWARSFDLNIIDGLVHLLARVGVLLSVIHGWFDRYIIDGVANLLADVSYAIGAWLRGLQTGYLRSYVLFLVIAAVGIWVVILFIIGTPAPAGPTP
ncbi:MAG: NADH-quinone oxidoreductase subunit L [Planctomycetes bacterium]|nr:NADH-quinone oxidoreductase subunit L [Planctomycetota bacterium]